jgi:hypothetical protein
MSTARTIIVVEAMASDPRPLSVRERRFLKALGRRMGLRVTSIRNASPADQPANIQQDGGGAAIEDERRMREIPNIPNVPRGGGGGQILSSTYEKVLTRRYPRTARHALKGP